MRKLLHKGRYIEAFYTPSLSLLETFWFTEEYMEEAEYRKVLLRYIGFLEEVQPQKIIIDASDSHYTIGVDTQAWVNENVYPVGDRVGVQQIAFIVSPAFYTQLSLELTVDDSIAITPNILQRFFGDIEEARIWLRLD